MTQELKISKKSKKLTKKLFQLWIISIKKGCLTKKYKERSAKERANTWHIIIKLKL